MMPRWLVSVGVVEADGTTKRLVPKMCAHFNFCEPHWSYNKNLYLSQCSLWTFAVVSQCPLLRRNYAPLNDGHKSSYDDSYKIGFGKGKHTRYRRFSSSPWVILGWRARVCPFNVWRCKVRLNCKDLNCGIDFNFLNKVCNSQFNFDLNCSEQACWMHSII